MFNKEKWIWYFGDFEIHHHMKLSLSRRERGSIVPTFWKVYDCNRLVKFEKTVTLEQGEHIEITMDGVGYLQLGRERYKTDKPIYLEKGEHRLSIVVGNQTGIPALRVKGNTVFSDESWLADALDGRLVGVGYMDNIPADVKPSDYELPTERIEYQSIQETEKGRVYDFGRETYIKPVFKIPEPGCPVHVVFGESLDEVMSDTDAVVYEDVALGLGRVELPATACRYIRIVSELAPEGVYGLYEYLPLESRGNFTCSDEDINKIYEISDYTLRLNSRLFYLDGIKRDVWVWGGDAYQSFFFNYYCHYDKSIIQRTLLALRGGDPIVSHVNTIVDYSLYWLISLSDYCLYTGDYDFIRKVYDKAVSLMDFCQTRENGHGLLEGYRTDWTFVDWADMEKHGALCVIQILYCKALESMAKCAQICDDPKRAKDYLAKSEELGGKIVDLYWREELGAFVTTFSDGKASDQVRRHANLFAIIFGIADSRMTDKILQHVIKNDNIPAITTPYFKFYELEALCRAGEIESVTETIRSYWGGMLAEGATSFWEEYDPNMQGAEHYAMYGKPFDKSLCHAWGASPLYLLGRYFLGVRPLEDGYASFEVCPNNGGLDVIKGTVPVNDGSISVESDGKTVNIQTDVAGGVFVNGESRLPITPGQLNTFTV
jgi:alpha-L-rhamnosidase